MAKGFIYIVRTVTASYQQTAFCNVPTQWKERLYFGPCKKPMRPRMSPGDYVFGISPSGISPRRVVFAARIEERITFAEAYERLPDLRGPPGPIHVRPVTRDGGFPSSAYEHIPGAMHAKDWKADLGRRDLDRFFICHRADGWQNRWLGPAGPEVDDELAEFFRECAVHGAAGWLADRSTGTKQNPVAHEGLFTGLHLETDEPQHLLTLCAERIDESEFAPTREPPLRTSLNAGSCGGHAPPRSPCGPSVTTESAPRRRGC